MPTSKDYFERAGEGAVAIRHSLAFSRRKSHAADGAVMVDFKWVSVPVLVMGPPLPAAADQATLRHVWTKNLIRQSAAQRTRPVAGLGRLSETEKALLDKQPELLKAMPRRYVQITRMARALSQQLLESDRMSESATRSLAFDIATDLRLAIERRMPNG